MAEKLVGLVRCNSTAVLSLKRAARHNALVPELLSDLLAALEDDTCQHAAAVVLRAEGRSFSTGGDLLAFQQNRAVIQDYAGELVGLLNQVILAIYRFPVPVVCAVQGQVTGGALGLLLAADRVIMHKDATITPWYAAIGFSPDGGWTAMLPAIIGRARVLDWLTTNATYAAGTCFELGLVQQVAGVDCDRAALSWAEQVAKMQSASIASARRLLNGNIKAVESRLEAERVAFVKQVQTPQALAGINRFLNRS